jgi:hypothetical protein
VIHRIHLQLAATFNARAISWTFARGSSRARLIAYLWLQGSNPNHPKCDILSPDLRAKALDNVMLQYTTRFMQRM